MAGRLVVIQPDSFHRRGTDLLLEAKTLSGVTAFARQWPGDVTVVARPATGDPPSHLVQTRIASLQFDVILSDDLFNPAHRRGASATLALHTVGNVPLLRFEPHRLILLTENPLRQRLATSFIGNSAVGGARSAIGHLRRAPALWNMVRAAGGIQCNGYPTWNAYAHLSDNPILFFDSRVTDTQIAKSQSEFAATSTATKPLTAAFSGRLIAMKGPQYAIQAIQSVSESDIDRIFVLGDGDMAESLKRQSRAIGHRVDFVGHLPYETEWVEFIRQHVNVMLLPHTQGDPAGTYIESSALGVPVVGFANQALSPLADRHGIGWTVRMRTSSALSTKLKELARSPQQVRAAGERGIDFASRHTFETEFRRRVLHIREVVQD
ncbi:glycosyltransferase [Brevibacterium senegalense]|uniref:glycosyltransferase n=1 Tax=Brevibacterium senegalense TaxID=1033736 RepID=UPI0002FE50D4|nr:glycosyltransferase [Brevibacterium senegalense]